MRFNASLTWLLITLASDPTLKLAMMYLTMA